MLSHYDGRQYQIPIVANGHSGQTQSASNERLLNLTSLSVL